MSCFVAVAAPSEYRRNRPSGDQLVAITIPALVDRTSSFSSLSPLTSFSSTWLLLNVKAIRFPSGDQTGYSAIPLPSVNLVVPLPCDTSISHRSALVTSCGIVRDATARVPSGDNAARRNPACSETRPDRTPCRSHDAIWTLLLALR